MKNVLKGIVIGLANIIPGVSGGTMAVSMGIYDKLIHCISHFFSDLKKNILFLIPLGIGMVIAIIGSSFGIDYLFAAFPVQTNMLFVGLILGSLPAVHKKVKGNPVKPGHIISALLFFALVAGMAMLNGSEGGNVSFDKSFVQIVLLFLVGVVASGTMVIPGVSGSMMLLLLGYYNPILATIKDFIVALTSLDGKAIADALFVLVPFGIGVVVGIIVLAKLVEFIFNKFPLYAYWSIIGLLIASPIAILMVGTFPEITIVHILTGIVTFALGWFISLKLGDKE